MNSNLANVRVLPKDCVLENIYFNTNYHDDNNNVYYYKLRYRNQNTIFYVNVFPECHGIINSAYPIINDLYTHNVHKNKEILKEIFSNCIIKYQDFSKEGVKLYKCVDMIVPQSMEKYLREKFSSHIYGISDLHWYDNTILIRKFNNRMCNTMEEYVNKTILNINETVPFYATLIIAGDVYSSNDKNKLKEIRNQISCKDIKIVRGNHDNLSLFNYKECGFNDVQEHMFLDNKNIIITHKKMPSSSNYRNVFGHIHGEEITSNTYNISFEGVKGKPKSFYEIANVMSEKCLTF